MTDINYKRWLENGKKWKAGTPLDEHVNVFSYPEFGLSVFKLEIPYSKEFPQ